MIPVYDVNPVRRTPWVTYALVAASVAVFLRTPGMAGSFAGDSSLAEPAGMAIALPLRPGTGPPPEPEGLLRGRRPRPPG